MKPINQHIIKTIFSQHEVNIQIKKKIMDIYPSHDSAAETEKPSCSMIDILVVQDEYSAHFLTSYFLIPAELLLSIIVYFDMLLAVHQ